MQIDKINQKIFNVVYSKFLKTYIIMFILLVISYFIQHTSSLKTILHKQYENLKYTVKRAAPTKLQKLSLISYKI